jgi:GNAT superfamily N-acetyltransferase
MHQQPTRVIRPAVPNEAQLLTELALRSKGYWGYDPAFLVACRDDLTITSAYVSNYPVFVIEEQNNIVGFYSLRGQGEEVELVHLFVEPGMIGSGYGKQLWQHAVATAAQQGFGFLIIESDPFAEAFYLAMGAVRIGVIASPVQVGRVLPLLRFSLRDAEA